MDVDRQIHFQAQRVISLFISACLLGTDSQANSFSKSINKLALKKKKNKSQEDSESWTTAFCSAT